MKKIATALILLSVPASLSAEPIGRWWSGFGQGTMEYAIKNDSAGGDYFYIACPSGSGATIRITVGGKDARPLSNTVVVIGADEYELFTDQSGDVRTDSHVGYDNFRSVWNSMRKGSAMRVRLSTGQSTVFTLKGAAKVLPRQHCQTGFEQ